MVGWCWRGGMFGLLLLALLMPAYAAAQSRAAQRVALSVALDGSRSLAFSLLPTGDGRATGTLSYADRGARLRFRAGRIDSFESGEAIAIVGSTAGLRGGAARFHITVRAPTADRPGHVTVDLSGADDPAYRFDGDFRYGTLKTA